MPAPPLRIPVALDMDSLRQQMDGASNRVGEALKGMGRAFTKVNGEILGLSTATATGAGLAWSQSFARQALGYAGLAAGAVVAFKAIGSIIDVTREKLEEMVSIADKARDARISPEFFQRFTKEAQNLKVSLDDLEGALKKAFDATKEPSPIDLDKWEVGEERITGVEKALRVYNETLAKTAGQTLQGLVLFRDADTQEKKALAILDAMRQLNSIGQQAAALDLGEKLFGAKFIDNIRQGKLTVEGLIKTINDATVSSTDLISNETVLRAKEVDDQLKLAHQRLDREMKPTMEGLANAMLTIKSLWADVVGFIADAVALLNSLDPGKLSTKMLRAIGIEPLPAEETPKPPLAITVNPSRGTGAAPTLKQKDSSRDRFDASADAIEKRTAALRAEVATIDLGTAARERARIAAQLETVAMQINKEAGLGANVVTAEQRQRIDEVAEAYGRAALAIERAHSPLATFARESANIDKQLNQFAAGSLDNLTNEMAGVVTGTKSLQDAFKSMSDAIINDLARIAIRKAITGPIASALGGTFGFGSGDPFDVNNGFVPSINGGGVVPSYASGTDFHPGGPARVHDGEIINLPRGSQVIPNDILRGMGGGGAPQVYVSLIEDASRGGQVDRQSNGQGGIDIKVFVDRITAENAGRPGSLTSNMLAARGVEPPLVRR